MTKELSGGIHKGVYSTIHNSLRRKHGNAYKCEAAGCKSNSPKRFEWALKKGRTYSDDKDDYIQMCPSCHRKYDETDERRLKLSQANKGRCYHGRERSVKRIDKKGRIKIYISITEAALSNLFKYHTGIMNCLSGLSKTAGGFRWQYN